MIKKESRNRIKGGQSSELYIIYINGYEEVRHFHDGAEKYV
ncbi:hypothetical protein [Caminicella sporogenes]|nr:hypothetical protein [Caminicella sporogenes]WIF95102.1 hypothetical protein QNI18_00240 [Caminicella sporogenes]